MTSILRKNLKFRMRSYTREVCPTREWGRGRESFSKVSFEPQSERVGIN